MLSLQHQSQVGHGGLGPNGQGGHDEGSHRGGGSDDHLQHHQQLHHPQGGHEQLYGTHGAQQGAPGVEGHGGHPEDGGHHGVHGYPEGLPFGYPPQMAGAEVNAAAVQGYPYMGLGSLQLAQMGSLIQGQQYALLPSSEDAVYVNQKQYHRILKRRQARMKLEARFKVIPRKEWLHDSRHQHAKNRMRGPGGRFLSKEEREKYGDGDMPKEENSSPNGAHSGSSPSSPANYQS
jgi:hypothetical protein